MTFNPSHHATIYTFFFQILVLPSSSLPVYYFVCPVRANIKYCLEPSCTTLNGSKQYDTSHPLTNIISRSRSSSSIGTKQSNIAYYTVKHQLLSQHFSFKPFAAVAPVQGSSGGLTLTGSLPLLAAVTIDSLLVPVQQTVLFQTSNIEYGKNST